MANSEHYTASEFKQTSEYKELKAELYAKPREIKDDIPENAETPPETSFGNAQSSTSSVKKPLRKRAGALFDTLQRSLTRLTGSIAGTVAAGAAAVALTVGLVSSPPEVDPTPPPVPTPAPQIEHAAPIEYGATLNTVSLSEATVLADDGKHLVFLPDVFTPGENSGFLYTVAAFDSSGQELASYSGRDPSVLLSCDAPPAYLEYKEQYDDGKAEKTYAAYTAKGDAAPLLGVGSISIEDCTVLWGDTQNEISIPLQYQIDDEALFYRLLIKGQDGELLNVYEGTQQTPKILLPAEVDVSAVTLQYVYRGADTQHLLYEKELSGQLYLKAPVIEFLDKELVRDGYSIAYRVTSQNAARERYLELCFYEAIQDIDIVKDRVPIGGIQYLLIPMDSSFTEIDLSATLRLKGAYGGNERVVSASHIYQNQPELLHRVAYDLQYDSISFNFTYFAPPGSYVLITDQLTSTTVQATDSHHVSAGAGAYHFTYQLTSPAGEPLGEAHEVRYQTPDSTPLFEMLHVNPGNILQTWNEDGTVNLYADTNFFCEDPNVFYEIEYVGERTYTLRSRDPLAKIERLPDQPYAIIYRVFYVVDGIEYLTYTVAPSGTTGTSLQVEFDATGTIYGAPALILGVQGKLHGPIELAVNGKPLALTEAELTQDGSFLYYCFDETVQTLYVKLSAEPTNDDIEYIKEKYGEDAISGNHFFTVEFELE